MEHADTAILRCSIAQRSSLEGRSDANPELCLHADPSSSAIVAARRLSP